MVEHASFHRFHLEGLRDTGRVIGRGAYAVVKELEFRGLKCVGKKIHSVLYESASPTEKANMLQRFATECELLERLHHPHIVQFLGICMETGSKLPELVMEYLPTTLRRCLDTHGALPSEIGSGILLEVALGLRYLHESTPPIIHRDLSSNNVLLTTGMSAKISDLGVAKILEMSPARSQVTQTQAPGTPAFMPPEAVLDRPKYTTKVDIFSFGVLIVHVLSGEWPSPSEPFAADPLVPNSAVPVTEFNRRRESIAKIAVGHPLLELIQQCLNSVFSYRPSAMDIVHQLQVEYPRVPPRPDNQLELLHQVHSFSAKLQQSFRDEVEAQRREIMALKASVAQKDAEFKTLQQSSSEEIQVYSPNISTRVRAYEERAGIDQAEAVKLQAELKAIRHSSAEEIKAVRRASDMLLAEKRREIAYLQEALEREQIQHPREIQTPKSEMASTREQPTVLPKATHNASQIESPLGLSPLTRMQWRRGANAPEKFSGAQAVVIGESVYVGGGSAEHRIFQYNWKRKAWSTLPECPVKLFGLTAYMHRLTTVGGRDRGDFRTGRVFQFDCFSRKWCDSLPPMPTARSSVTVITHSRKLAIAVCGGRGDGWAVCTTVEVLCHSQWLTAEPLPMPLWKVTSATIGNVTYLLGGDDSSCLGNKICYFVNFNSLVDTASSSGEFKSDEGSLWFRSSNTVLIDSCATSLRSSLLTIGGRTSDTHSPSVAVQVLTDCGAWEMLRGGNLPEPRFQSTAVNLPSGELMVVGGSVGGLNEQSTVFIASVTD